MAQIENMTPDDVPELEKFVEERKKLGSELEMKIVEQKELDVNKKLDEISNQLFELNCKIDRIFGNLALVDGKFFNLGGKKNDIQGVSDKDPGNCNLSGIW